MCKLHLFRLRVQAPINSIHLLSCPSIDCSWQKSTLCIADTFGETGGFGVHKGHPRAFRLFAEADWPVAHAVQLDGGARGRRVDPWDGQPPHCCNPSLHPVSGILQLPIVRRAKERGGYLWFGESLFAVAAVWFEDLHQHWVYMKIG